MASKAASLDSPSVITSSMMATLSPAFTSPMSCPPATRPCLAASRTVTMGRFSLAEITPARGLTASGTSTILSTLSRCSGLAKRRDRYTMTSGSFLIILRLT